ncbi:hypothetical protein GQ607_003964 [Colletotrichum asianum]|uniref:Uncharacterized protein n=1 Tax=Colletotrichum asianum TaxID=702518 RepID=A0A8H3WL68_9PEZI|nr:hypothetical protein GQ607_003964 [Colletotrichum asianum]
MAQLPPLVCPKPGPAHPDSFPQAPPSVNPADITPPCILRAEARTPAPTRRRAWSLELGASQSWWPESRFKNRTLRKFCESPFSLTHRRSYAHDSFVHSSPGVGDKTTRIPGTTVENECRKTQRSASQPLCKTSPTEG